MNRLFGRAAGVVICVLLTVLSGSRVRAADDFESQVNLKDVRLMAVQSDQTLKTFDTFARDTLFQITGNKAVSLKGKSAPFVVLDMAFRPEAYENANILYIRNIPFRTDFEDLAMIDSAEKERIKKEGTVSLAFWLDPHVRDAMARIMSQATVKATAIRQIDGEASALAQLLGTNNSPPLANVAILPPLDAADANAKPWATPGMLFNAAAQAQAAATTQPTSFAGYSVATTQGVMENLKLASDAWRAQDAAKVQTAFAQLAAAVEQANPAIYPSLTKRKFELLYNSLFRLTLPGAMLYFVGFVLFLLAWKTEGTWFYRTAAAFTIAGWLVHVSGIAIRWWLVSKNVGNWFEAIPIKNQFESVLMSAFFGVTVALILERWKRVGIFGAAAACVGMLSLVAIFSAPYVTGRDIGGEIKQNAGILMTYWLYVHVTLVTASYALIGMTFVMGVWYVVQYLKNSDAEVLKTIDDCNLVMLQLAFWILGTGIICGALLADVSWGRPWGWDPKETFALVTWIVYLIIIHVRFVTSGRTRALTTGILSIVGFGVMLFNWIGVNFFLVGLHSYA
ncbi:MAG: cytochrome c biogenesis protein [Tepidisphaeraceae bacterium]